MRGPSACRALAWEEAEPAAGRGAGVLRLLLQPLLDRRTSGGLAAAALAALAALVAGTRADRARAAMAPALTSGALRPGLRGDTRSWGRDARAAGTLRRGAHSWHVPMRANPTPCHQ